MSKRIINIIFNILRVFLKIKNSIYLEFLHCLLVPHLFILKQQCLHSFSMHLLSGVTKLRIVEFLEDILTVASARNLVLVFVLNSEHSLDPSTHFIDLTELDNLSLQML